PSPTTAPLLHRSSFPTRRSSDLAKGVDVVVATPGRLKDLMDDNKIRLNETRWLVLDEADRMLDMGFIAPVRAIAKQIGLRRQTRSEEHTSELQSRENLVCRLLLE